MYAALVRPLVVLLLVVTAPVNAVAQSVGPIPAFVVDLRGFYTGLGQDPVTAGDLGVTPDQLPARGFGGAAGLHLYPLRGARTALGVGADGILIWGRAQEDTEAGEPPATIVQQNLQGLSGQLSLNFGDRNGWSYVTAGIGPLTFKSYVGETAPTPPPPKKMTINMGGGARWFFDDHVAISFDVRFYLTRPEALVEPYPRRQRSRLLILSGGVSFK